MALFFYRGRDNTGKLIEGEIEAGSALLVAHDLQRRQIIPVSIEELILEDSLTTRFLHWLQHRSVTLDELIIFCRQMHSLTRAGVPVVRAVQTLSSSSRSATLRHDLESCVNLLQSGQDLTTAFNQHPETFSPLFVNMINVGENTGRLEEAFSELAAHMERERETRKRIQQATRYPTFVLAAIFIALMIINYFVIPAFAGVFAKLHAQLPLPTRILIGTSNFFIQYGWLLAILAVVAFILLMRFVETENGRYLWHRFKLRLPIVGGVFERIMLSRFSRSFAMMMRSGVPVIQALNVVSRAVDNEYIGRAIRGMAEQIERGDTISRTATATGMFSPLVLQMLMVGEESGTLEEMLKEVSDFYDEEVDYDLKRLTDAIEPLLIVGIGGIVLVLALGVFLPLWDLSTAFHHH